MTPWPEWFDRLPRPDATEQEKRVGAENLAAYCEEVAERYGLWALSWRERQPPSAGCAHMEHLRENESKFYAGRAAELRRCLAERGVA